jgi:hypothetical protein
MPQFTNTRIILTTNINYLAELSRYPSPSPANPQGEGDERQIRLASVAFLYPIPSNGMQVNASSAAFYDEAGELTSSSNEEAWEWDEQSTIPTYPNRRTDEFGCLLGRKPTPFPVRGGRRGAGMTRRTPSSSNAIQNENRAQGNAHVAFSPDTALEVGNRLKRVPTPYPAASKAAQGNEGDKGEEGSFRRLVGKAKGRLCRLRQGEKEEEKGKQRRYASCIRAMFGEELDD